MSIYAESTVLCTYYPCYSLYRNTSINPPPLSYPGERAGGVHPDVLRPGCGGLVHPEPSAHAQCALLRLLLRRRGLLHPIGVQLGQGANEGLQDGEMRRIQRAEGKQVRVTEVCQQKFYCSSSFDISSATNRNNSDNSNTISQSTKSTIATAFTRLLILLTKTATVNDPEGSSLQLPIFFFLPVQDLQPCEPRRPRALLPPPPDWQCVRGDAGRLARRGVRFWGRAEQHLPHAQREAFREPKTGAEGGGKLVCTIDNDDDDDDDDDVCC